MTSQAPLLVVEDLCRSFGGLRAVDHVSFLVVPREIVGLLGPNGAGKTTCFNLVSGVLAPTSGRIIFDGRETTGHSPAEMASRGIGRTFQIVKPFASLSVLDNVVAALGLHRYRSFFGMCTSWKAKRARDRALEILDRVGIADLASRKAGLLPLGNLRRLEIARALALEPKLLLLDECFSGLRPEEIVHLEAEIRRIRDSGVTVLLIEHNMKVAMALSDRIVVLDHGRKIADGLPRDVAADPLVIEAYLGKGASGRAA